MKNLEPYQLFFPIGWALGFLGVLLWIPWILQPGLSYPGLIHPEYMVGGFLLMYAFGFLTTAIPRFTGTESMSMGEKKVALLIGALTLLSLFMKAKSLVFVANIFLILFLIKFAMTRVSRRNSDPPPSFLFVGFGLILALVGLSLQLLGQFGLLSSDLIFSSRSIFYLGFMLSFVLGIGSRLIPGILGHQAPLVPKMPSQKQENKQSLYSLWTAIPRSMKILGFFFLLSFISEILFSSQWLGDSMRLGVCIFIAFNFWRLHRRPKNNGIMSYFLWISACLLVLSQIVMVLRPDLRLHAVHLLYITGFGLMTLMISTRVTLAHSGQDLSIERLSLGLLTSGVLIVIAAFLRFFSALTANYNTMLFAASSLWCIALLTWICRFGKYWLPNHSHPHHHE